jgi:hypothetical protein
MLPFGGRVACGDIVGSKVSELLGECGYLGHCCNEFLTAFGQGFGERRIGIREVRHSLTVLRSGSCKVSNGVDGALLWILIILGMETHGSWGDVQCFIVLFVCNPKINFKLLPCFVRGWLPLPYFTAIGKNSGTKNTLIRNAEDLCGRGVWPAAANSMVSSICL